MSQTTRKATGVLDILVIDDDPIVTRMLSRVLSGHVVQVANTGQSALERLRDQSFDLILCDLTMPGMSGIELYKAIRASSVAVADRVVFMTGGAYTAEGHEFLAQLPNSWLEKPFDLGALKAVALSRMLEL
jgi:CheY-like chemotaxis protein